MDSFDYNEHNSPTRRIFTLLLNVLTILVLLSVVCVVTVFLMIFINPNNPINPFPPQVIPTAISLPTATPTPRNLLPPTWTPSPTVPPSATATAAPTDTPQPSETPFSLFTATATATSESGPDGMPFVLAPGTPIGTSSATFHPEEGCNWMGVAGQVFDLTGAPVSGQQVRIGGTLAGAQVDLLSLTGLTNAYGTAGFYEFKLGDTPTATNETLWIQLLDQAGLPMSDKIYFETFDTCDRNLVFINLRQVR